ncbi:hypothetical protein K1719_011819 [Acacia pycnantha]|nr:hypothetical protein K1719_011819 [Acacia pycnantha]
MAGALFRLFLIFLGLSHLLCLKAVPITRSESLMQVPKVHVVPKNKQEVIVEENMQRKESSVDGAKMLPDLEWSSIIIATNVEPLLPMNKLR